MAGARGTIGTVLLASAMLALCALAPLAGLTGPAQAAPAATIQPQPPTLDEFKATLSKFGQFIYSERYGNVWQPTSLPTGWHPYPACHWVYDRSYGWTYDDATAWGKIVHHYGRWAHDDQAGWVWIPGTEWAPAWVIWRSGGDWTGWAPTPPSSDQQEITLASFNADKQWTFMETAKLANRCEAEPAAAPATAFTASAPVTGIKVVRGIAVYVLPQPAIVIDYDTGPVAPWKAEFLGEWLLWLNAAAPAAAINVGPGTPLCPAAGAAAPYISTPPPPPQGQKPTRKRAYYPPPRQGRAPAVVQDGPGYEPQPTYIGPPVGHRTPDWTPPYGGPRPYPRFRPVVTRPSYQNRPFYPRRPGPYREPLVR